MKKKGGEVCMCFAAFKLQAGAGCGSHQCRKKVIKIPLKSSAHWDLQGKSLNLTGDTDSSFQLMNSTFVRTFVKKSALKSALLDIKSGESDLDSTPAQRSPSPSPTDN